MSSRLSSLWHDYSLGWVYLAGWLLTWGLHALFTYWTDFYPHGTESWVLTWLETSFENLASEYHQVGALILLTKYFIFKDSAESRDGNDRMQQALERIERKMDQRHDRSA